MTRAKAPTLRVEEATRLARELFGVEGRVTELPSYIDQNFLFDDAWILKVANAYDDEGTLDLQNRVMEAVSTVEPGLVPTVRASTGERGIESVESDGETHFVRMVSFLPGTLLGDAEYVKAATWEDLGATLGRLDRALLDFRHDSMGRWLRWDLAHASWIVPKMELLPDTRSRALVERVYLQFVADVLRKFETLPRAIIYNDANDQNIVVDDDPSGCQIRGLFDFGDVVWTARVFEPAIAAAYASLDADDPLEVLCRVAAGYHDVLPLEEREFPAFFPSVCMRLAVSVVVSAQDVEIDPDNEYIQTTESRAWRTLERLAEISPAQAEGALREACGSGDDSFPPLRVRSHLEPNGLSSAEIVQLRRRHVGPSLSLSYDEPLEIVRGRGQYLFDRDGRSYLDGVNNVCHVGHCHPKVVEAAQRQIGELNTNTRYLHENIARLAERLAALFPDPLEVCYFVNSGSEANELALRLAQTATGRKDMIAIEHGYHGHSSSLIDLSSYKHAGPGGQGAPEWVHVVPCPDPYRGKLRGPESGPGYARFVSEAITRAHERGFEIAGMIAEPIVGCGGQVVPPDGYLCEAFEHVRAAGGLCIADEVQVGFGRVGSHWWAFDRQGAMPDIVTVGKPFGNGHPLAAVITTREIADAFDNGMEFFATFGGNPVSCAVGLAVLDVIEEEGLRANAEEVGSFLLEELRALADVHEAIGDVRGQGFYLGVEIVRDRETREPDPATLAAAIEAMRRSGILMSTDGPDHNVLKFKPPIVFDRANAELFLTRSTRPSAKLSDRLRGCPHPARAEERICHGHGCCLHFRAN